MKTMILILTVFFMFNLTLASLPDESRDFSQSKIFNPDQALSPQMWEVEANPNEVTEQDNSPRMQLWRQIINSRKTNNLQQHDALWQEYRTRYQNKLSITAKTDNQPYAISNGIFDLGAGSGYPAPDWGTGDVLVHNGAISSANTTGNFRSVQIEVDSLGNHYAAVLSRDRDSLLVYKSLDDGVTWTQINRILPGGTTKWHSFDFFITDTSNIFKLGFAAARISSGIYGGQIYWMSIDDDGSNFRANLIQTTPTGRGLINPAIISDGYIWSATSTYWYVTYQNVDETSGVGNAAVAALSMDWGDSWTLDSARTSFNDYDLDIDYNFDADTIHVLLTNNLTPTNENLRIRRTSLNDFGSSSNWRQFNPASTGDPEHSGCLVSNRETNELVVTYTIEQSGNNNIGCAFSPTGHTPASASGTGFWNLGNLIASKSNDEERCRIDCQESQGAYRLAYVSQSASRDTIIYSSTFTPPSFLGHQIVNFDKNASPSVAPDVAGFRTSPTGYNGGVIFAGFGPTDAWYDGSNITPVVGISDPQNTIVTDFELYQNYPNPFNPTTTIRYRLANIQLQQTKVQLFNSAGQLIRTLVNEMQDNGQYQVVWDGLNDLGQEVSSGVYFYQITSGSFQTTKKLVKLK
jgi:hypothetical protein